VGLFRRREPLHKQLAREGGLTPRDPRPPWQETGIHGIHRAREWDETVTGEAPDVEGDAVRWVALPDGTLLVEEGADGSLDALAALVETKIAPPYRARGARQVDDVWSVQATKLEVIALPDAPEGDSIEVAQNDGTTTLAVDGRQVFGSLPALEQRGEREGPDYAVHAERLDGDLFEIRASAL
jgi:hypothetical protein